MKRADFNRESGQAFMELTIMLLILTGMILAVVMLSGVEMRSNSLLLSARNNAQKAARDGSGDVEYSEEYSTWYYPSLRLTTSYINQGNSGSFGNSTKLFTYKKRDYRIRSRNTGALQIPFSYQGRIQKSSAGSAMDNASYAMTSSDFSMPRNHQYESYVRWREINAMDNSFVHDFSGDLRSMNAFHAARLIGKSGDGSDAPATMNRYDQAGIHSVSDATEVMYRTFSRMFGIDISNLKLRTHETNKVYLPQLR